MRNTERGTFYNSTLRIVAGLGTLAVLATPVSAERKKDTIDCKSGTLQPSIIYMELPDGEYRRISSDPDLVRLLSRRDGGLTIESRLGSSEATFVTIGKAKTDTGEVGIFIPGESATVQGLGKNHEITKVGRTPDNSGSWVSVTGECKQNAPQK
jgi:hypothetical protein